MEEEQVIPAQETQETPEEKPSEGRSSGKKFVLIIVIILVILLVGGGAYFFGRQSGNTAGLAQISPTPYVISTPSPTPELEEPSSPTASGTLTPTKKPTPTPTPTSKTKIISSKDTLDGFRSSNAGGNSTIDIRAGRNVNLVTRGFVSFDLSGIPSGITVKKATLRLYQKQIIGDPYGAGGSLKIDHLVYGDGLDDADYGVAALSSSFATLTNNATLEWKDSDVTDSVKDDLGNARSQSQYRIHFSTENTGGDVLGDFAYFESAENAPDGTGNTPQLVVEYY